LQGHLKLLPICAHKHALSERDGTRAAEREGATRKQEGSNNQGSHFMRRKLFNMPEAELAALVPPISFLPPPHQNGV